MGPRKLSGTGLEIMKQSSQDYSVPKAKIDLNQPEPKSHYAEFKQNKTAPRPPQPPRYPK